MAMPFECHFSVCSLNVAATLSPSDLMVSATTLLQKPPNISPGLQLPFSVCVQNKHCTDLVT